jgi:hypothetical protein
MEIGKLRSLRGRLAEFNGKLVRPTGSLAEGLVVELNPKLQLTVKADQVEVVPNFAGSGRKRTGTATDEAMPDLQTVIMNMAGQLRATLDQQCAKAGAQNVAVSERRSDLRPFIRGWAGYVYSWQFNRVQIVQVHVCLPA